MFASIKLEGNSDDKAIPSAKKALQACLNEGVIREL
jgi:hypothetical protein